MHGSARHAATTRCERHSGWLSSRATLWFGVALLAACAKPAGVAPAVQIECQVSPTPPVVGMAQVDVSLADPNGAPIAGARVSVEGNMNHAGMTPSIGNAKEIELGRYRAEIELTMGGDWFLLLEATLADGREVERNVPLPGVRTR